MLGKPIFKNLIATINLQNALDYMHENCQVHTLYLLNTEAGNKAFRHKDFQISILSFKSSCYHCLVIDLLNFQVKFTDQWGSLWMFKI